MAVVRALVGGIVGGAAGTFLAQMVQGISGSESVWWLLFTGLGTGIGARVGASSNRSFASGVVAAVVTVLLALGSNVAEAMAELRAAERQQSELVLPTLPSEPSAAPESEDGGGSDLGTSAAEDESEPEAGSEPETNPDTEASNAGEGNDDEPDLDDSESSDPDQPTSNKSADATDQSNDAAPDTAATPVKPLIIDESAITPAPQPISEKLGWTVMDFIVNGLSSVLAFAIAAGTSSASRRTS